MMMTRLESSQAICLSVKSRSEFHSRQRPPASEQLVLVLFDEVKSEIATVGAGVGVIGGEDSQQ